MKLVPQGTVVLLFTDIEGSTRLWETVPEAMKVCLARHDELVAGAIEGAGGRIFKTMGDAFCAAFVSPFEAIDAVVEIQRRLHREPWPTDCPIKVRAAVHVGAVELRNDDYFGPPLNRVARLLNAARGGQIVLSLALSELVRDSLPIGCSITDLGLHRLKDLVRPEHIFQLRVEGLIAEFPALISLDNPDLPNNLPQQTTSFIGREREMAQIKRMTSESRLVTLVGSGGSGKSRLTLQMGAELLGDDPDGVWLVELAAISDGDLVPSAILAALSIPDAPGRPPTDVLIDTLRLKRLVLLVDNCEHVLDVAARTIDRVLKQCPGVRIIANSREALNIPGEAVMRVPSLSIPPVDRIYSPESLSQFEAVRLFIARAEAASPGFEVTTENAPAVAEICYRLDGIPFALELAAARVKTMSVSAVHERLNDRFRLLTGGARTAMPRHQTLRALFDWSYDLLDDDEKRLFRRLAVFAGGWTLDSAHAVCASEGLEEWEMVDLLASLVDKSLAQMDPESEPTRYRFLESARQYASQALDAEELNTLRAKHAVYFSKLAARIGHELAGPDAVVHLRWLESERDNLRAAFEFSMTDGKEEVALAIASDLRMFFWMRGPVREGESWMARALDAPGNQNPTAERAGALFGRAVMWNIMGDQSPSLPWLEEALEIRRRIADEEGEAVVLNMIGIYHKDDERLELAESFFEQSLAIRRRLDLRSGIGSSLTNLGSLRRQMGDPRGSLAIHLEALEIKKLLGEAPNLAISYQNIASLSLELGERDSCISALNEGLRISIATMDRRVMLNLLDTAIEFLYLDGAERDALLLKAACDRLRDDNGILRRGFEEPIAREDREIPDALRREAGAMDLVAAAEFALAGLPTTLR